MNLLQKLFGKFYISVHSYLPHSFHKKEIFSFLLSPFLLICSILLQFFTVIFAQTIPFGWRITINIFCLLLDISSLFGILHQFRKLECITQNLEQEQLYNQSLKTLHDDIRGFKHDFSNIIQSIGGYIINEDMIGLKTYYSQLFSDCQSLNALHVLTPKLIDNPAIFSLLSCKYNRANDLGITFDLNILLNLNELNMKIYEFCRILGILLDNAIEATSECEEKVIYIDMKKDKQKNCQLLIIENTYSEKNIDTNLIFQKGISSKPCNTGLGLWEVKQILKKNRNVDLHTSYDGHYFKQRLEIYERAFKKRERNLVTN